MTNNLLVILFAAWAIFSISCTSNSNGVSETVPSPQPTSTPIQLPIASNLDHGRRNNLINEAVRFATTGCPGISERLSGPPTRVMVALTNSGKAGGLLNPEADFEQLGPEGIGAVAVWVVAIEGSSIPIIGEDPLGGANVRSFVFVIRTGVRTGAPDLTGCVVRDAPMPTTYINSSCRLCGGFEFEVLLDTQ